MLIFSAKDPAIDCLNLLRPNSTSVVVTGSGFGATQTSPLVIATSNQFGVGTAVTQSVTSWSDTSITFDVDLGAIPESSGLFLRVDTGATYPPSYPITVSFPDVQCASGTFTTATTTGTNVVVSGLSFQPKVVLFWTAAASGTTQIAGQGVGFSFGRYSPAPSSFAFNAASRHDAASYSTKGARSAGPGSSCSYTYNGSWRFGSVSPTSDGFSVNYFVTDTASRVVHWLAFGGKTVAFYGSNVTVSAGSLSSLPFRPDVVFVSHIANPINTYTDGPMFGLGVVARDQVGDLKQWSIAWSAFSPNTSSSLVHSKMATNAFAEQVYNGATTWSAQASSLGFQDFSWAGSDTDTLTAHAIFLDGAEVEIGTVTKAASASTTTLGSLDDPDLMLVATGGGTKDTVVGYANMAVGIADASSQSHARTWADLVGSLTEGTQGSDTNRAIGHYDSSGAVQDVGSLSLTGTPTITWDAPRAGTAEIAYLAFKMPTAGSEQTVTPDSTVAASAAHSTTASANGDASATPAGTAAQSIANPATAAGTGNAFASPSSTPASAMANDATANAAGSASIEPASNEAASLANASTATATGDATAEPLSSSGSSIANAANATATGDATVTPASCAAAALANATTATGEGNEITPESPLAAALANPATIVATGNVEVSASATEAASIANAAIAFASGNASANPESNPANASAHEATATPSGNAELVPASNSAAAQANDSLATASGNATCTPSTHEPAAIANAANATASGFVDVTPASTPPASVANPTTIDTGTNLFPESTLPGARAFTASAIAPAANPNPAAPGTQPRSTRQSFSAHHRITSMSPRSILVSRSPRMTTPPAYQPRIGDTSPAYVAIIEGLPEDIDNTTLRFLFKLPGSAVEHVRNATAFDITTGKATYQWEPADFPPGTKSGRVGVRWDFTTTAGRRSTTNTEHFTLVD
jgi:hypothetical protein